MRKSSYVRSGHVSLNTKGFRYEARNAKGVKLDLGKNFSSRNKSKFLKSLGVPKGTKTLDVFYGNKKVSSHVFKKITKQKKNFTQSQIVKIISRPSKAYKPQGSITIQERINEVAGSGAARNVESGYLPNSPYFAKGEFFKSKPGGASQNWRVYLLVKGEKYNSKKGGNREGWHVVSFHQNLRRALTGPQYYSALFSEGEFHFADAIKDEIKQHNLRLRNKQVKTRWFEDYFVLGVERDSR